MRVRAFGRRLRFRPQLSQFPMCQVGKFLPRWQGPNETNHGVWCPLEQAVPCPHVVGTRGLSVCLEPHLVPGWAGALPTRF